MPAIGRGGRRFHSLQLRTKLIGIFCLLVLIIGSAGGAGLLFINNIRAKVESFQTLPRH